MKFDHTELSDIVALQLRGDWSEAMNRLAALRNQELCLLCEANRAVCLFHLRQFENLATLAPGLARLYPKELVEYDVNRLMMTLLVLAMVAHHRVGDAVAACRFALEVCDFDYWVGDLPLIPTGILRNTDGALTIHDTTDGRDIVFVLFCLRFQAGISDNERLKIVRLLNNYVRLDPSGRPAHEVFEEVLLRDDTPVPDINFDVVRRMTYDDSRSRE